MPKNASMIIWRREAFQAGPPSIVQGVQDHLVPFMSRNRNRTNAHLSKSLLFAAFLPESPTVFVTN